MRKGYAIVRHYVTLDHKGEFANGSDADVIGGSFHTDRSLIEKTARKMCRGRSLWDTDHLHVVRAIEVEGKVFISLEYLPPEEGR